LHVLGTPPAFILSQDQTLHKRTDKVQFLETDVDLHYSVFNEQQFFGPL
jgi:hypothetical protein